MAILKNVFRRKKKLADADGNQESDDEVLVRELKNQDEEEARKTDTSSTSENEINNSHSSFPGDATISNGTDSRRKLFGNRARKSRRALRMEMTEAVEVDVAGSRRNLPIENVSDGDSDDGHLESDLPEQPIKTASNGNDGLGAVLEEGDGDQEEAAEIQIVIPAEPSMDTRTRSSSRERGRGARSRSSSRDALRAVRERSIQRGHIGHQDGLGSSRHSKDGGLRRSRHKDEMGPSIHSGDGLGTSRHSKDCSAPLLSPSGPRKDGLGTSRHSTHGLGTSRHSNNGGLQTSAHSQGGIASPLHSDGSLHTSNPRVSQSKEPESAAQRVPDTPPKGLHSQKNLQVLSPKIRDPKSKSSKPRSRSSERQRPKSSRGLSTARRKKKEGESSEDQRRSRSSDPSNVSRSSMERLRSTSQDRRRRRKDETKSKKSARSLFNDKITDKTREDATPTDTKDPRETCVTASVEATANPALFSAAKQSVDDHPIEAKPTTDFTEGIEPKTTTGPPSPRKKEEKRRKVRERLQARRGGSEERPETRRSRSESQDRPLSKNSASTDRAKSSRGKSQDRVGSKGTTDRSTEKGEDSVPSTKARSRSSDHTRAKRSESKDRPLSKRSASTDRVKSRNDKSQDRMGSKGTTDRSAEKKEDSVPSSRARSRSSDRRCRHADRQRKGEVKLVSNDGPKDAQDSEKDSVLEITEPSSADDNNHSKERKEKEPAAVLQALISKSHHSSTPTEETPAERTTVKSIEDSRSDERALKTPNESKDNDVAVSGPKADVVFHTSKEVKLPIEEDEEADTVIEINPAFALLDHLGLADLKHTTENTSSDLRVELLNSRVKEGGRAQSVSRPAAEEVKRLDEERFQVSTSNGEEADVKNEEGSVSDDTLLVEPAIGSSDTELHVESEIKSSNDTEAAGKNEDDKRASATKGINESGQSRALANQEPVKEKESSEEERDSIDDDIQSIDKNPASKKKAAAPSSSSNPAADLLNFLGTNYDHLLSKETSTSSAFDAIDDKLQSSVDFFKGISTSFSGSMDDDINSVADDSVHFSTATTIPTTETKIVIPPSVDPSKCDDEEKLQPRKDRRLARQKKRKGTKASKPSTSSSTPTTHMTQATEDQPPNLAPPSVAGDMDARKNKIRRSRGTVAAAKASTCPVNPPSETDSKQDHKPSSRRHTRLRRAKVDATKYDTTCEESLAPPSLAPPSVLSSARKTTKVSKTAETIPAPDTEGGEDAVGKVSCKEVRKALKSAELEDDGDNIVDFVGNVPPSETDSKQDHKPSSRRHTKIRRAKVDATKNDMTCEKSLAPPSLAPPSVTPSIRKSTKVSKITETIPAPDPEVEEDAVGKVSCKEEEDVPRKVTRKEARKAKRFATLDNDDNEDEDAVVNLSIALETTPAKPKSMRRVMLSRAKSAVDVIEKTSKRVAKKAASTRNLFA